LDGTPRALNGCPAVAAVNGSAATTNALLAIAIGLA